MAPALDEFRDPEVEDEEEVGGTVACPLGWTEEVELVVNVGVVEVVGVAEEMEVVTVVGGGVQVGDVCDTGAQRSVWELSR